jgi:hypothetical protein
MHPHFPDEPSVVKQVLASPKYKARTNRQQRQQQGQHADIGIGEPWRDTFSKNNKPWESEHKQEIFLHREWHPIAD